MDVATGQLEMFGAPRIRARRPPPEPILREAELADGCRFSLVRIWGTGPRIAIAGLNPSHADGRRDDPTMLREMAFASAWGFGSLVKVNVYPVIASTLPGLRAWRAGGDRAALETRNIAACAAALRSAEMAWAAWGRHVDPADLARWMAGLRDATGHGVDWQCLGANLDGSPRHTLARGRHRIPDDAALVRWQGWGA